MVEIQTKNTLCSYFLHTKYCSRWHSTDPMIDSNASSVWKRMLKVKDIAELHIKWVVGKWDIDAYKDIWCPSPINQGTLNLMLSTLFNRDVSPDADRIKLHLGSAAYDEIMNKSIYLTNTSNQCVWDLRNFGFFYFSSTWQLKKQKNMSSLVAKNIWHQHLPLKIFAFMWNLIHNALSTDLVVQRRGIHIVPKWCCCMLLLTWIQHSSIPHF